MIGEHIQQSLRAYGYPSMPRRVLGPQVRRCRGSEPSDRYPECWFAVLAPRASMRQIRIRLSPKQALRALSPSKVQVIRVNRTILSVALFIRWHRSDSKSLAPRTADVFRTEPRAIPRSLHPQSPVGGMGPTTPNWEANLHELRSCYRRITGNANHNWQRKERAEHRGTDVPATGSLPAQLVRRKS
jgi:hypothetical protein